MVPSWIHFCCTTTGTPHPIIESRGIPIAAPQVKNPTSIHVDMGSIPELTQDLVLLWLWYRAAAVVLIWPLAWEFPYAAGSVLNKKTKTRNKQKQTKKKKKKKDILGVPNDSFSGLASLIPHHFGIKFSQERLLVLCHLYMWLENITLTICTPELSHLENGIQTLALWNFYE